MFIIEKHNKILLTKGDNAEFDIRVYNKDGKEVEIQEGDKLVMTVRKNAAAADKSFDVEAYVNTFYIEPEHTNSLASGLYVYDVQYTNVNGEVSTIIPTSYFELLEEVTR